MRQQPSAPVDRAARTSPVREGLRVPFGLRQGVLVRPNEVPAGLACGCQCPGCGAPLVAKAGNSQFRRPHFSHLADADCGSGYESALHLKAKQLIAQHARLWLPAWEGDEALPNPPVLLDDDGTSVSGRKIELPPREAMLARVELEIRCGDYIPDVFAADEEGELLIEVRVTHAVDDIKRGRIQSEGRRLVEIDLSRLEEAILADEDRLSKVVLEDLARRTWLSFPTATEAWRESYRDLKAEVAVRNREISRRREAERLALARRVADDEARRASKERFRQQLRAPYAQALADLPELTSVERTDRLLQEYQVRDLSHIAELLAGIANLKAKEAVEYVGAYGWIYTVHPSYWQAAVYRNFIQSRTQGDTFNQRDVARWVLQQFGKEEPLYSLFLAQYSARRHARAAGIRKHSVSFWAFTALENQQIPDFYRPINHFMDRLVYLRVLERVPGWLGELRVMPAVPDGALRSVS